MSDNRKTIHVVAAVIEDTNSKILIAKRPMHVHQGGLWEFPGGKVEEGETPTEALARELQEELNIHITQTQPVIQIRHEYTDKSIFLDVKRVKTFTGNVVGNEGQSIKWIDKDELFDFEFPAANKAIVSAVQLPTEYLITPEYKIENREQFLTILESRLKNRIKLVQLRAKSLTQQQYTQLFYQVEKITKKYSAILVANTSLEHAIELNATHIHLNSKILISTHKLPVGKIFSASCHNSQEINKANELSIGFIIVSPVNFTQSHPDAKPIGWQKFSSLCQLAKMPVFALGGMGLTDYEMALDSGAQGIAGISKLWDLTH